MLKPIYILKKKKLRLDSTIIVLTATGALNEKRSNLPFKLRSKLKPPIPCYAECCSFWCGHNFAS